jgi:PiT family inorganic phosphate transporter
LHWLSAGTVSFARGVNDTPKMAALLLGLKLFAPVGATALVAIAIAAGGLIAARRVAETMSRRITQLDPVEGLASNLSTATLVLSASMFGLPVSTTHVAVGSLFGIGVATRQANGRTVGAIVLSWILTLPVALAASALTYLTVARLT